MKKLVLNISIILLCGLTVQAQEKETQTEKKEVKSTVQFKLKNAEYTADSITQPKIYIDGKVFNFDISLIDQDQIKSINVIKGDEAMRLYDAPQGVILIKTKSNSVKPDYSFEARKVEFRIKDKNKKDDANPLIIIDGKEQNQKILKKLNPDDIESIEVFKDEKAIELYKAPQGVIVIKTKKGKKDKK